MSDTPHPVDDRDWVEDFAHENGQYFIICRSCKTQFMGHKRRLWCKVCASKPQSAEAKRDGQWLVALLDAGLSLEQVADVCGKLLERDKIGA